MKSTYKIIMHVLNHLQKNVEFVYLSIRAHQHLRSLAPVMNEYGWLWWPNDIWGPWGPKASRHLSYRWRKTPKKPHPGNLSRPGIEPGPAAWQARMLPLAPQRRTKKKMLNVLLQNLLCMEHFQIYIIKTPMAVYDGCGSVLA